MLEDEQLSYLLLLRFIGIGGTALQRAVESNRVEVVRYLLTLPELDVNENENTSQWTPLLAAAIHGFADIVKLLLEHPEVDVSAKSRFGHTALIYASMNNHHAVVRMLLADERVDVNATDDSEDDALMLASKRNALESVELLLAHPKIELRNTLGKSALAYATSSGNSKIVSALKAHEGVEFKTEVGRKLKENNLGQYARKFYDAKVDTLEVARSLTRLDLSEMMVDSIGDRKRILRLFGCVEDDEKAKEKVDDDVKVVIAQRVIEEQTGAGAGATAAAPKRGKKKNKGRKPKDNVQQYEALPNAPRSAVVVPVNSDEEEEGEDVPYARAIEQ